MADTLLPVPESMRIIEFTAGSLRFAESVPSAPPADGFVWIYLERDELEGALPLLQQAAQTLGDSQLLDLHALDLGLDSHPSNYDYTSIYDLIVFRRLALPGENGNDAEDTRDDGRNSLPPAPQNRLAAFTRIRSQAVGFVIFDRLLISVHPGGCPTANGFVKRFLADIQQGMDSATARSRRPSSPADLALRMINGMVDSYLELRRDLTAELERWQVHLLRHDARNTDWNALMNARSQLHVLEDLCEEQLDAMQEWLDSLREQPLESFHPLLQQAQEQRDMLVARARRGGAHRTRDAACTPAAAVGRNRGADPLQRPGQPHQRHHARAHHLDGHFPAAQSDRRRVRHELQGNAAAGLAHRLLGSDRHYGTDCAGAEPVVLAQALPGFGSLRTALPHRVNPEESGALGALACADGPTCCILFVKSKF